MGGDPPIDLCQGGKVPPRRPRPRPLVGPSFSLGIGWHRLGINPHTLGTAWVGSLIMGDGLPKIRWPPWGHQAART